MNLTDKTNINLTSKELDKFADKLEKYFLLTMATGCVKGFIDVYKIFEFHRTQKLFKFLKYISLKSYGCKQHWL